MGLHILCDLVSRAELLEKAQEVRLCSSLSDIDFSCLLNKKLTSPELIPNEVFNVVETFRELRNINPI